MTAQAGYPPNNLMSNSSESQPVQPVGYNRLTGTSPTVLNVSANGTVGNAVVIADVLVYGATLSGCMAAIRAKRMGASVALVSAQSILGVGGMFTGGVMNVDARATPNLRSSAFPASSILRELMEKLWPNYTYYVNGQASGNGMTPGSLQQYFADTGPPSINCANEPHVTRPILLAMLQAEGIPLYTDTYLLNLETTDARVPACNFSNGLRVVCKQAVDATYTGDLLAEAGVTMTTGRESEAQYAETGLGAGYNVQASSQPSPNINPYRISGNAASGLIYGVYPDPGLAQGDASPYSMAICYRLAVTNQSAHRAPWPAPDDYDPTKYELQRRWMTTNGTGDTGIANSLAFYGSPGGFPISYANKFDANNGRTFCSLNVHLPTELDEYIRATSIHGLEAGHKRRGELEYLFKQHILGWIYFMCTDLSVPSACRANWLTYGPCLDEYSDNGYFPPYPYLRVGRRMVSDIVVTGPDVMTPTNYADPIAKGYYNLDSHRVQYLNISGAVKVEGGVTTGNDCHVNTTLPLRCAIPPVAEAVNVSSAWCISISSYAWNGIRLEPTMAQLGEAIGAAAALAAKTGGNIQDVAYADVAWAVDWWGFRTYGGAIIKTDGSGSASHEGSLSETGVWADLVDTLFGTTKMRRSITPASSAAFLPVFKQPGAHDVYLKWDDRAGTSPAQSNTVTVTVLAMGVVYTQTLNFRAQGSGTAGYVGGDWCYLGRFSFAKGDNVDNRVTVTTTNTDAVSLVGCKFIPALLTK